MKNRVALPQLTYIVFELVRVNIDDYLAENYRAVSEETVFLAVMPEQVRYANTARDAIAQTDSNVFINRFDLAPERVSISGTFGDLPRLISGTYMDGWSRLQQFEKDIVKKSKRIELPTTGDDARYLYMLNYYDFWWQRFGSANIASFEVRGNAREISTLPRYSCDLMLVGDLIDVQSRDLLLLSLKELFAPGGFIADAFEKINEMLGDAAPYLQIATIPYDNLGLALQTVNQATEFIQGYSGANQKIYQNVERLF